MIEMAESKEAAQAIYAAYGIMNYRRLGHDTYFNEELEVAEVRYKHALHLLKRAFPGEFCDWTEQSAPAMYRWTVRLEATGVSIPAAVNAAGMVGFNLKMAALSLSCPPSCTCSLHPPHGGAK